MSTPPAPFASPSSYRPAALRALAEAVPPAEDLEQLQKDLVLLKQRTLERARKAAADMRTFDEAVRRLRERERAKSRGPEKIKKERDGNTPLPDAIVITPAQSSRGRLLSTSSSNGDITPVSSKPPIEALRVPEEKKKKKKRKREIEDSDTEHDAQRIRKASPLPPPNHSHHSSSSHSLPKPQKIPIPPPTQQKTSSGPDWSLPAASNLLPPRPPIPPAPIPGPSHPGQVEDDFSKAKQPAQTQVTTFYTSLEPWLRPIKEEDIGFLGWHGDEVEPYIVPAFGRPYAEVWAEEDIAQHGAPLPGTAAATYHPPPSPIMAPGGGLPRWEPSSLAEPDLLTEERGNGPLTERVLSALLPAPDPNGWKGVKAAEEAMEGRSAGGANAAAERDRMTVADLEERVRDSMRFLGLLDEKTEQGAAEPLDDPIATALRQAQRELRIVAATNKARRTRLAAVARDRLATQEYVDLRDSLDRNIVALYTRYQKKDTPRSVPTKKKKGSSSHAKAEFNGAAGADGVLPPCPAMLGLPPDEEHRLTVPEQLDKLVKTRRTWVDGVGGKLAEVQEREPGRLWGLREESLYAGIKEEIERTLGKIRWGGQVEGRPPAEASAGGAETQSAVSADARTRPGEVKMEIG